MPHESTSKPPGLLSSSPTGIVAALSLGAGFIALVSLVFELLTHGWLANAADLGVSYLSLPMGVAAVVLAALTARRDWRLALPGLALGAVYWVAYLLLIV